MSPISPGAVPQVLEPFFRGVYGRLGRSDTILAAAAAHHRLLWIHPFLDGNGRVTRLMSQRDHAGYALDTGGYLVEFRVGSRATCGAYEAISGRMRPTAAQ